MGGSESVELGRSMAAFTPCITRSFENPGRMDPATKVAFIELVVENRFVHILQFAQ
jgi:hypothetical protein